jgi:Ca2+-binding RTX toxin-like protein
MTRFASQRNCSEIADRPDLDAGAKAAATTFAKDGTYLILLGADINRDLTRIGTSNAERILPLLLGSGEANETALRSALDEIILANPSLGAAADRIFISFSGITRLFYFLDAGLALKKVKDAVEAAPTGDKVEAFAVELATQGLGVLMTEAAGLAGSGLGGFVGAGGGAYVGLIPGATIGGAVGRKIGEVIGEAAGSFVFDAFVERRIRTELTEFIDRDLPAPGAVADWGACDMEAAGRVQVRPRTDPLILDLDGDGVELAGFRDSGVYFDIDGDGVRELTSWAKADDGLLALDRNRNGEIDDVNELFGTETVSGFAILSELDANGDRLISAADPAFARLRVWRDFDQDGRADRGELIRLADAGVRSIDLNSVDVSFTIEGSVMSEKSVFTRTNGTTALIADVWLQYHNADVASTAALSGAGAAIDLRGTGALDDLSVAAGANSALKAMVNRFSRIATDNPRQMASLVEQIMFEWAGVSDIAPQARGAAFDARRLGFIEKALDTPFMQDGALANPTAAAAVELSQAWAVFYSHAMAALFAQTAGRAEENTRYLFSANATLSVLSPESMVAAHQATAPAREAVDVAGYWHGAVHAMDQTIPTGAAADVYSAALDGALRDLGLAGKAQALRSAVNHSGRFDGTIVDDRVHMFSDNDDTIVVTGAAASIFAGGGNDVIEAAGSSGFGAGRTLNGGSGNDTIAGGSGADWIDGGSGIDIMAGGRGDDTYVVDSLRDLVIEEEFSGTDTVRAAINLALGRELEHLELIGEAVRGTGNVLSNRIVGNDRSNRLEGLAGNDTIDGGIGRDTMAGGTGGDTYVVDNAGDVVVETGSETDTVIASVDYVLGLRLEILRLTGAALRATGNASDNSLFGNDRNNILDGKGGADQMAGGRGDDLYIVDDIGDSVSEQVDEGIDTVRASTSHTLRSNVEHLVLTGSEDADAIGNTLDNKLTGNTGNNRLDGTVGADTMAGGKGDDSYVVDNARDRVIERKQAGIDTVQTSLNAYTLGTQIENLQLFTRFDDSVARNGTGNGLDNAITGTGGVNVLTGLGGDDSLVGGRGNDSLFGGTGDDTLDGGTESDRMVGGAGDDLYIVDAIGDTVIESAGEGIDTVFSAVSFILAGALEHLTLTGFAAADAQGNAGANMIVGNRSANNIDGGLGADTMIGGAGNDTYTVDNRGDVVIEAPDGGTDTVRSSVSAVLSLSVENLVLTGGARLNGSGNALANVITGNSSANRIEGRGGADTLTGGAGADTFVWRRIEDGTASTFGSDRITDFSRAQRDKIDLALIDANPLTARLDDFDFVGSGAFTGAGQIRVAEQGGSTFVFLNTDSNLFSAEMVIALAGSVALRESDFIL